MHMVGWVMPLGVPWLSSTSQSPRPADEVVVVRGENGSTAACTSAYLDAEGEGEHFEFEFELEIAATQAAALMSISMSTEQGSTICMAGPQLRHRAIV